jgi:hypothetical protein
MTVKVKEISLRYGLFDVNRDGHPDNCIVMRKNNTLYFHTDVRSEDMYEIGEVVNNYKWKCGVQLFTRIVERLTNSEDYENGSGEFSHETEGEFDIRFVAPCGDGCYVQLASLKEIVEKFCGNGEETSKAS